MPSQGDLASTPFPVLLGWARSSKATGVLSVSGEKFIFFLRGTPVHVDSVVADESSEVYLRTRVPPAVDEEQLAAARAAAEDSGRGVGEALLGLGFLDPSELFELKRSHAKQKLVGCFGPRAGTIRFEPRESFGSELLPMPLDVLEALREGLGRFYDRERLERELPVDDLCRVAVLPGSTPAGLATDEARILQLAASRPTLQAITTSGGMRPDDVRRHLYALYCLGLLGFELGAPIAEESESEREMRDPLPVPKAGTVATRKPPSQPPASQPVADAKPPSPTPSPTPSPKSPSPRPTPSPMRSPTPSPIPSPMRSPTPSPTPSPRQPSPSPSRPPPPPVASTTPAAARAPAPPGSRPSAPPPTPPAARRDPTGTVSTRKDPTGTIATGRNAGRSIDEAIEAAEIARAEGDLLEALAILRAADQEAPGEPRVQAQLALLMVLVDPRKNAKEANRLAHEARKASPSLPMPYVVMGILLEQIGQKQQAAQMYRHALTRDPDEGEASRRLQFLEGVKPTR